ncbi:MAG: creatininase family protein [Bryobacterales bacterium]|nr:creatininase family protein [Bryobacterales bacterium]
MPSKQAINAAIAIFAALPAAAQIRPLHTRDLTRLSQVQVAAQLKTSDVIFIPVGAVETNGIQPSARDYVSPLAFAMAMAEDTAGLYMPGLIWSYPGTTIPAPSTIQNSPAEGTRFLKHLAYSLLRQGFRRQVYLSYSHGPAPLTAGALVREFFDETRVPILYINLDTYLPRLQLKDDERHRILYGAHWMTGRITDLALRGEYGDAALHAATPPPPPNTGLSTLGRLGFSGSLSLGSWINDVMAHGPIAELPATAAEREEWGRHGQRQIESIVQRMRMKEAMEALRQHDRYTQQVIVPRLRPWLPETRTSPPE